MDETKKRKILIACIAISVIPSVLLLPFPSLISLKTVSLWVADVLGYVGLVLLLWMFTLGAKSIMGLIFKDLAHLLHIHKWLGKYGSLAIMLHPLLVIYSYGESLLYAFIPLLGTQFERHVTLGRIAFALLLFTWGLSWFLRKKIPFRLWKYLHYLAYICIPFAFLHVPDVGSNYMRYAFVKAYFFVLAFAFIVLFVLRLRGFLNLDKSIYTVSSHIQLTDTDYLLTLTPTSFHRILPRRGQYVYVKLGYISEDHPFSVLHYDETTGVISVGYRVFGSYTRVLTKMQKGGTVYVGGPYGNFMAEIDETDRPIVFLTGGIGITPFVDQILHHAGKREQWLFAANRSRDAAVLVPQVAPALGDHLVNVYNTMPSDPKAGEESGYLTIDLMKKYLGEDLNKYEFYFCGPPAMMKSLYAVMDASGVPKEHRHSEKFGW